MSLDILLCYVEQDDNMFVTTAGRTNQQMMEKAEELARELNIPYVHRLKRSILTLKEELGSDCLVMGKERLELYPKESDEPFFFHPNSAMFRIKRLLSGEHDPFIDASQLTEGMSVLDCTLGLGSDAIVASFVVGNEGRVIGVEGQKYLAYMVNQGLCNWKSGPSGMDAAMKRIRIVHSQSLDYLKSLPNGSVDCIYFDPMFEETILESDGIKGLSQFAIHNDLTSEMMNEALRVARKRIILKDHYKSSRFEKYGFKVIRRKTAKFHFGFILK
jgi:hypothetical protein